MPFAQLLEARQRVLHAASAGCRRDCKQRVRDTAHRGHDDRWTAAVARPGVRTI